MFQLLVEITRILPNSGYLGVAQEFGVFVVFILSAWAWRNCRDWRLKKQADDKWIKGAQTYKPRAAPRSHARDEAGLTQPKRVPTVCASNDKLTPAQLELAHKQMMQHLDSRQFTLALNMYRASEREGNDAFFTEELYSAFCQSAIKVGKVDVVELMLRAMRRNRVVPSLQFWHTLFKMLSSRKLFAECLSVHATCGKLVPTDITICSCLINAALEVGNVQRALALIPSYDALELNASNYVLHFRTFAAANEVNAAEVCFRKLGPQMTPLMLNLLLLMCVKGNEPERAHSIVREAHGIEATHQVSGIVDLVSYNTVLKGYLQSGLCASCFECFREMMEHCIEPDDITVGLLFEMSISDGKLNLATELVTLIMGRTAGVSTSTGTLFIKGFVRSKCLPKAMEVYEAMRSQTGPRPDIITYSVLMRALADAHDLEKALELLGHMRVANIQPDDIILTHLLEACRHDNNIEKGKELFEELVKMGVTPSEFTLVALLKLHGRCGSQEEAFAMLSNWEKDFGKAPSVIHFTCIMTACIWWKKYDLAWAALELMHERGVAVDSMALTTLLQGLVAGAQWHRVVQLARLTLTAQGNLDAGLWNMALAKMLTVGGADSQAEQLRVLMQHVHMSITARDMRKRR